MLKPHSPSSPTRPPVEHFYFTVRTDEGEEVWFFTHGFGAEYAAHYWISAILEHPAAQNWKDDNTLVLTDDNGYTLTIKGSHLEDMIEYQPNKEEKQWTPPYPDSAQLERLTRFETISSRTTPSQPEEPNASEPKTKSTPKPKPIKQAPRHRSQKPSPDGTITVAALCAEYNLQPNKGRNLLRKAKIEKPQGGWTFKLDDPILPTIREVLAKG